MSGAGTYPDCVVVTGASSGFGAAIARRAAIGGARIVVIGRRLDRLREVAAPFGARAHVLQADVRDGAAFAEALQALPAPFDEVGLLVNNAGIGLGRDRAQEARIADWLAMVETNVTGLIAGTQALLPGMVARGSGHVINIGSLAAAFPTPRNAIYAASKAFMRQFAYCLRADLLGTGVRVTTIEPGQSGGTEFTLVREHGDAARAEAAYGSNRLIGPDDVADAIDWVVSRPAHVNVNLLQLSSIDQAFGPLAFAASSRGMDHA